MSRPAAASGFRDDESSDESGDDDVFGAAVDGSSGGGGGGDRVPVGKSVTATAPAIASKGATTLVGTAAAIGESKTTKSDKSSKRKKRKKKPQVGKESAKGTSSADDRTTAAAVASLKAVMFSDPHRVASAVRPSSLAASSRRAVPPPHAPAPVKSVVSSVTPLDSSPPPPSPSTSSSSGSVDAHSFGADHANAEVGGATVLSSSVPLGPSAAASSSSPSSSQRSARREARVRLEPRRFPAVAIATSETKGGPGGVGSDEVDSDEKRVAEATASAAAAAAAAAMLPPVADREFKSVATAAAKASDQKQWTKVANANDDDDDATTDYTENESYVEDPRRARWKTMRAGVEGGYAYRGGVNTFAFVGCFRSERPVWRRWVRAMRYLCTSYLLCDTAHATDVGEQLGAARRGITRAMKRYGVPGEVYCRPWVNFGVSKSHVWQMAREHPATRTAKYFITCDADEVFLMQNRPDRQHRPGHALFDAAHEKQMYATVEFARELETHLDDLHRRQGATVFHFTTYLNGTVYPRPHIAHRSAPVRWRMPVQEHLATAARGDPELQIRHVDLMLLWARKEGHSSRNARSPIDKRDLLKYIAKKPRSTRAVYYLAQSYGDTGDIPNAIVWYARRYELSRLKNARGYDEEAYQSLVFLGSTKVDDRKAREIALRIAVDQFPARLEAYQMLMQLLRLAEKHRESYEFGRRAVALWRAGPPVSGLFVNSHVYTHAFALEYSLAANKSGAALAEAIYVAEEVLREPERIDSAVRADIVRTFRRNLAAFKADLAAERARVAANIKAARLLAELGDGGFAAVAERQRQRMLADGDDGGESNLTGAAKRHQSAIADIKRKLADQASLRAATLPAPAPLVSYPSRSLTTAPSPSPTVSTLSFSSARHAPPPATTTSATAAAAPHERGNGSSSESESDADEEGDDDGHNDDSGLVATTAPERSTEITQDASRKLRATESDGQSRLATPSDGSVAAPKFVESRGNGSSSSSSGSDDEQNEDAKESDDDDDDAGDATSADGKPRLGAERAAPSDRGQREGNSAKRCAEVSLETPSVAGPASLEK